jgi:hypothetical protein
MLVDGKAEDISGYPGGFTVPHTPYAAAFARRYLALTCSCASMSVERSAYREARLRIGSTRLSSVLLVVDVLPST